MKHVSIQRQVALTAVGLTVVTSFLYLAITIIVAFAVEDRVIENLLEREQRRVMEIYKKTGEITNPSADYFAIYKRSSDVPVFLKRGIDQERGEREIFTPGDEHYHYRTLPFSENNPGYLIADVTSLLAVTNNPGILILFMMGVFVTLVISVWFAFRLSRSITQPIIHLSDQVDGIAEEQAKKKRLTYSDKASQFLDWQAPMNEVGILTEHFKRLYLVQEKTIQRETEFTTDVSHELRTPLTIMQNAADLIQMRGYQSSDLKVINEAIQEMKSTTEALLLLARSNNFDVERIHLVSFIKKCTESVVKDKQPPLVITNKLPEDIFVNANSALLEILIKNLLENAEKHSSSKQLDINFHNGTLFFKNQANVSNASDGRTADLTEPGITSQPNEGIGQGLFLVKRIAHSLNLKLEVSYDGDNFMIQISGLMQ